MNYATYISKRHASAACAYVHRSRKPIVVRKGPHQYLIEWTDASGNRVFMKEAFIQLIASVVYSMEPE